MARELIIRRSDSKEFQDDPELFVKSLQGLKSLNLNQSEADPRALPFFNDDEADEIKKAVVQHEKQEIANRRRKDQIERISTLSRIVTPIVSVLLTFLFITWFGGKLQEDSFNRNAVFNANIQRYEEAQRLTTEIMFNLRDAAQRIGWYRGDQQKIEQFHRFVRAQRNELVRLEDILRTLKTSRINELNESVRHVSDNIDQFLRREGDLRPEAIEVLRSEVALAMTGFLDASR